MIFSAVDAIVLSFPFCRIVLMDDAVDYLMSFADFLYAFQLQFYYQGTFVVLLTFIPLAVNIYLYIYIFAVYKYSKSSVYGYGLSFL